MHTMKIESHIDRHGCLMLQLPSEWADQNVNVVVVLEKNQNAVTTKKNNLLPAFDLLAGMPDDFMQDGRQDNLPQERDAFL